MAIQFPQGWDEVVLGAQAKLPGGLSFSAMDTHIVRTILQTGDPSWSSSSFFLEDWLSLSTLANDPSSAGNHVTTTLADKPPGKSLVPPSCIAVKVI